jgi:hypothetical protein
MTRKDIQFIAICIGATALVVIAAHLLWPPKTAREDVPISQRLESTTNSVTVEPTPQEKEASESALYELTHRQEKIYKEGDTISFTYTSYTVSQSGWYNSEFYQKPDAMFLLVELTVRNDDKRSRSIHPLFMLIDENGVEYIYTTSITYPIDKYGAPATFGFFLNPGVQKHGCIVFDIPQNHKYKLKIAEFGMDALIELSPKSVGR